MLTRLQIRNVMHDTERNARLIREGNAFAIAAVEATLEIAAFAYLHPNAEPNVAKRISAAIGQIEAAA